MCQASTCGQVLARALVQVLQNSGSQVVVLRFTTLSAQDRHWRNPRKINYRECSNIKRARVSALTGSVPRKMAEALQSVSALIRNHVISPNSLRLTLTTKTFVRIKIWKKWYVSSYFATCNLFFCVQDWRTRIFQFEYQGQIRFSSNEIREFLNANLWSIYLIAFDIDWSWNIFTLHNFCSMLIEQLINLEKVKTDNLKFRTDLRGRVMDGWSVTQ